MSEQPFTIPEPGTPQLAHFDGRCPCGDPIIRGVDQIIRVNGVWVHDTCESYGQDRGSAA